jgi:hypothetical protein
MNVSTRLARALALTACVIVAAPAAGASAAAVSLVSTGPLIGGLTLQTPAPAVPAVGYTAAAEAPEFVGTGHTEYVLTPTPSTTSGPVAHAAKMQPFPNVRIAGVVTTRGARIRLLAVQAPPRALVTIRCSGRGCRVKSQSRLVQAAAASTRTGMWLLHFPRFEHGFPGGTVLRIFITRGSDIGKYTNFRVRRARLPRRRDECLEPRDLRPILCPLP